MVASRSHRDLREELSLEGIKMKGREHVLRREGKRQKGDETWSLIQSPCPHYFSSYLLYRQGEDIIRNKMEVRRQEREGEKKRRLPPAEGHDQYTRTCPRRKYDRPPTMHRYERSPQKSP